MGKAEGSNTLATQLHNYHLCWHDKAFRQHIKWDPQGKASKPLITTGFLREEI